MKNIFVLISICGPLLAQSYPPAQGPLPPPASDHPQELQIRLLVDAQVRAAIDDKLNGPPDINGVKSINAQLAERNDVHALVSASSFTAFQPYMTQTQYPDRPNSNYLLMRYMVGLMVSHISYNLGGAWIGYPWDRSLSVSLEVGIYCDHWETGAGKVLAV